MSAEAKLCPRRSNSHNVSQSLAPQLTRFNRGFRGLFHVQHDRLTCSTLKGYSHSKRYKLRNGSGYWGICINHHEQTYNQLWPQDRRPRLQPTAVKLHTYSGEQLTVKGVISVEVQYNGQSKSLSLIVTSGRGPILLGRDWLTKIRLDWTHLCNNHVCYSLSLQGILADYSTVFDTVLGTLKGFTATIIVDPAVQPHFAIQEQSPMP